MHGYDDRVIIPALTAEMARVSGVQHSGQGEGPGRYYSAPEVDLSEYDNIILCLSGGKDSIACLLHLMDLGVDPARLELWHHDVDGREGSTLMDWPFSVDYNRKLAAAFGLPLWFSWLEGGFEGEMLRQNATGRPHCIETPEGLKILERDSVRSRPGTRLKFPQVSASLQTRWCSSSLKIDVGRRAINNQPRFDGKNVLFITGERREESANRARYNQLEPHACDRRKGRLRRRVDAWRPVLHWSEERVWETLERWRLIAPVPYRLGWGRSSCMKCIFNDPVIWATLQHYFPGTLDAIAGYESRFGTTISRRRISVLDVSRQAEPMPVSDTDALKQALSVEYTLPLFSGESAWLLPPGAFSRSGCGPS